jgi:hypothetical protein
MAAQLDIFFTFGPPVLAILGICLIVQWAMNPSPTKITYAQLLTERPTHGWYAVSGVRVDPLVKISIKSDGRQDNYYALRSLDENATSPVHVLYAPYAIQNEANISSGTSVNGMVGVATDAQVNAISEAGNKHDRRVLTIDARVAYWWAGLIAIAVAWVLWRINKASNKAWSR